MDETWVRWILGGLGALIVTIFSEMFRRLFAKQDEIEKTKANKQSTDERFEDAAHRWELHAQEDREMHRQVGQKLDAVVHQIGITNATLANLAGRFDEARRNGNSPH